MGSQKAVLINLVGVLVLSMPCVLGYKCMERYHTTTWSWKHDPGSEDFIVSNNLPATWKSCLPAVLYDEAWMGI